MIRRLWISVASIIGVAVALLALNLGFGNSPALGLDLQGGLSVILAPTKGATGDDLLVIRDLIRDELERRGIAEPDVRVEGPNIIVDLPGVRDQRDALDAVDVAGIVTLRPVYQCVAGPEPGASTTTPGSGPPGSTTPGSSAGSAATTTPAGSTAGTAPTATTTPAASAPTSGPPATPSGFANPRPEQTAPPTTEPSPATTGQPATTGGRGPTTTTTPGATTTTAPGETTTPPTSTPAAQPQTEVLPMLGGGQCVVGPPGGTGEVFGRGSAHANLDPQSGGWVVQTSLTDTGKDAWNALAFECNQGLETCPSHQLAIVLDNVIQSAPVVQQPNFPDNVQITGMDSEGEARSLSRVLNRGAFPVNVEAQTVQTVSPTLGQDSLRASIIAGMVGVVLVLLFLVVFYRRLTLLIVAGMIVWGMLIYSAAAIVSQTTNYALTLAGVTGIIVSIGVTVDSYVVYFERLKDEVRHGRTFKNSADRAFRASWRTIVAADLVSILAATVLFVLSVGSVRGFALYLGITTVCDLIVFFCFTRPAVALLAATGRLDRRDTFGLGVATQ